jgi:hypothetical protein
MGYEQFHVSYGGSVPIGTYVAFQRRSDQLWFRPATGTLTARTQGDSPVPYRLPLTSTGGDSFVLLDEPAEDLPATTGGDVYIVHYYNQLTDPATDDDDLLLVEDVGWNGEAVTEPADAAGDYIDDNDLGTFLGEYNLTLYADTDGDSARDVGAVQQAIDDAESDINLYAGGGPALTPLAFAGGTAAQQAAARKTVEKWAKWLAAYYVAAKRGLSGVEMERFAALRDRALSEIGWLRDGTLNLPGLTADPDDVPDQAGEWVAVEVVRADLMSTTGDEFSDE